MYKIIKPISFEPKDLTVDKQTRRYYEVNELVIWDHIEAQLKDNYRYVHHVVKFVPWKQGEKPTSCEIHIYYELERSDR